MSDVATGWSERVVVLGRSAPVMEAAFQRILIRLPFPIIELHPDNGSEFLNYHLLNFFKAAVEGDRLLGGDHPAAQEPGRGGATGGHIRATPRNNNPIKLRAWLGILKGPSGRRSRPEGPA